MIISSPHHVSGDQNFSASPKLGQGKPTLRENQAIKLCQLILEKGDKNAQEEVRSFYPNLNSPNPQKCIEGLRKISALRICGAQLKEVPEGISLLENLISLDLRTNHLTSLSEEILALKKLRNLFLSGNPIEELPPFILNGEMKVLTHLALNHTEIKKLPYALMDIIDSYPPEVEWE